MSACPPLSEWIADPEGTAAELIRSLPDSWQDLRMEDARAHEDATKNLLVMLGMIRTEHERLRLTVFGRPPREGTFGELATPEQKERMAALLDFELAVDRMQSALEGWEQRSGYDRLAGVESRGGRPPLVLPDLNPDDA